MKDLSCPGSTCQHCRFCRNFIPEGRRGGICQQLGVPVRSNWKACSIALPAFAPSWGMLEKVKLWEQQIPTTPDLVPLECYPFNTPPVNSPVNEQIDRNRKLSGAGVC